jgi:DNA replication and repair protein RecF
LLTQLSCRSFRNLARVDWRPGAGAHLLLGDNGAGKTSLLEAVYLLSTTRSFRTSRVADCMRHGEAGFHLRGEVEGDRRVALEVGWGAAGRYRSVNGDQATLAEQLGALPVVAWTAADGETLTGTPELRRRLLDQGVVGLRPGSIAVLSRYRRALAQKRRLLADGAAATADLTTWNEVLAGAALELSGLRRDYVELLTGELERLLAERELSLPALGLRYRASIEVDPEDDPAAATRTIFETLERSAAREREARRPLFGPHRDEVEILWAGRAARGVLSAGERKALGLVLLAARGRVLTAHDREPVYLLDDADTELDRRRLGEVWSLFGEPRQVFATSNREAAWEGLDITAKWLLEDGGPRLLGGPGPDPD